MHRRRWLFTLILTLISHANLDAEASGSTLSILSSSVMGLRFPYENGADPAIVPMSYRPLLAYDGEWKCVLCKEIPSFENQGLRTGKRNGLPYLISKWKLRTEAQWSDGRAVTGADFVLALDILKNHHQPSAEMAALAHEVDQILATDNPREFEIHHFGVSRDYAALPGLYPVPAQSLVQIWKECAQDVACLLQKIEASPLPTNGPFVATVSGQTAQLSANRKYKLASVKSALLRVRTYGQLAAVDINTNDVILGDDEQKTEIPLSHRAFTFETGQLLMLGFNLRNPILASPSLRQYLLATSERDRLEPIVQGRRLVHHLFDQAYWPTLTFPLYPKNSALKKQLKREGWDLREGLYWKDQKPLQIEIAIPADDDLRQTIADSLQKSWSANGVKVGIKKVSAGFFRQKYLQHVEFADSALFSFQMLPKMMPKMLLHSKEIPTFTNQYRGQNLSAWHHKDIDLLLEKFDAKIPDGDPQWFSTIAQEWIKDPSAMTIMMLPQREILRTNLKGFQPSTAFRPASFSVENWHLL